MRYVDGCLDLIFSNDMILNICKRVGDKDTEGERNRRKLDEMYNDWWIEKMKYRDWIAKHFKMTTDIIVREHSI